MTAFSKIGCAPGMWEPSDKGASATLEVEDFDAALATIQEKSIAGMKVSIVMGPYDFPTCRMVAITDPDGNRITLHKRKI